MRKSFRSLPGSDPFCGATTRPSPTPRVAKTAVFNFGPALKTLFAYGFQIHAHRGSAAVLFFVDQRRDHPAFAETGAARSDRSYHMQDAFKLYVFRGTAMDARPGH